MLRTSSTPLPGGVTLTLLVALALPALAEETPEQILGVVVAGLKSGKLDGTFALFDDRMATALPREKLSEVTATLGAQVGALKECAAPRVTTQAGSTLLRASCTFEKAPLDLKLAVKGGRITGLFFSPPEPPPPSGAAAYVDAASFQESDVTVGTGDWALPGTLSMPKGNGPFPAVVLVHGSGPQDRDETYGPNRPFRDLAGGLASRGIAVLRYEKRTKAHPEAFARLATATVREETVDDAVLAIRLLQKTQRIDPARVFLLGHSLGGMLAPRIAKAEPSLAGLVILAGTTRPLEDVIAEQLDYLGGLKEGGDASLAEMKKQAATIRSVTPETKGLVFGAPASYWLDLRAYRPAEVARTLGQRLLVLQGERDYQVTMKDLEGWRTALSSRQDVVFRTYPKLNHFFIEGEGKPTPDEYGKPGHVSARVIDDVEAFLKTRG